MIIENVVLKHLVQQEFNVTVGSIGDNEIDFIAEKPNHKIYVQCVYLMTDAKTRDREFGKLLKIKNNFRKLVVSMDEPSGGNISRIEHMHLRAFLTSVL